MNEVKRKKKRVHVFRVIFSRTAVVFLLFAVQIAILFACFLWLGEYIVYIYGSFTFLSAVLVIIIINEKENPAFKLAWMIPVMMIPVFGALLYIFIRLQIGTKVIEFRLKNLILKTSPFLVQDEQAAAELERINRQVYRLARYMDQVGGFPTYQNTSLNYFPRGEDKFEEMKKQLEQAEHFIFLEYFIVDKGHMWDSIMDILVRKAAQGVEVRMMYDGMCSVMLLPYHYPKELQRLGIQCKMFSPIKPALSTHQNNRDHRKILVIDAHTAFTGGINLADEYINEKNRFGHWKDTAVMIQGDAVRSFTLMFLQMWNVDERTEENYEAYLVPHRLSLSPELRQDGFVMPYADSPYDGENIGEQVYMDIINTAVDYVHIMTPYLILDNEMLMTLTYAAKRGVDITIIMPHIPDKIYAYLLARTYYPELIRAGVHIYEYTPGFVHAKVFVSDHIKAVVGTINLDYRSLYLHFECAVFIYKCSEILKIEEDFLDTLQKCEQITLESCKKYNGFKRLAGRVLRLIAPLM